MVVRWGLAQRSGGDGDDTRRSVAGADDDVLGGSEGMCGRRDGQDVGVVVPLRSLLLKIDLHEKGDQGSCQASSRRGWLGKELADHN